MKIVKNIQLKIVIFTAIENCCILHGRVFVMTVKGFVCVNSEGQFGLKIKVLYIRLFLIIHIFHCFL